MHATTTLTRRAGVVLLVTGLAAAGQLAGADAGTGADADTARALPTTAAADRTELQARAAPRLRTHVVMRNLDIPWDIAQLRDGDWLVTERDRERILLRKPSGRVRVLASTPPGFWHGDETGLMSIAVDPRVARNGRFYTCTGFAGGGGPGVRVVSWRINDDHTNVRRTGSLLTGIQTTSGRHGGCRIRFGGEGAMYVGTGDAAVGTNPQNLRSLNGKVLRLNRFTGRPWQGNPFIHAKNRNKRYVFTYGHRNVQGLARRPDGGMWSVEHGTSRDDEVNRLVAGGNYGWNPVPGYDESTPMTDFSLPGRQIGARWKSGFPTLATSGAVWVRGREWGAYQGTLAVCALKTSRLIFMKFDGGGRLQWARSPQAMRGTYGRLRSVVQTPSGALLVTTSNGGGADRVVRVTPR